MANERHNGHTYEFADFRLIPDEGQLFSGGELIPLPPKAFSTLVALVERSGRLVTKNELIDIVWRDAFIEEGALSKCIWTVRTALGEDSKNQRFIKTVPTRGYRFEGDVRVTEQSSELRMVEARADGRHAAITSAPAAADIDDSEWPEVVESVDEVSWTPALRRSSLPKILAIGIVPVILALSFGAYYLYSRQASAGNAGNRIAILPLKPVNVENRDPIVEFAIAESLILKLSSDKNLNVRPLSTVRPFIELDRDPVDAGKELNVDYVLSSNYQLLNGRIRVTSQLFNIRTGQTEETFKAENDASDVFSMQDAVANDLGNAVLVRFGTSPNSFTAKRGTANEHAYRLYSQAMYLVEKNVKADAKRSIELFDQAIALDPNYAAAWAGKGRAHCFYSHMGEKSPDEEYKVAGPAIEHALELDPNLADAYAVLGVINTDYRWNFVEAEKHFRRAFELAPSNSDYYRWFGNRLVRYGRFGEAIESTKMAIDLNPANVFHQEQYGWVLYMSRRYDEAIEQLNRVVEMDPGHVATYSSLWQANHAKGDYSLAFEYFMKLRKLTGASSETIARFNSEYRTSGWSAVLKAQQAILKDQQPKDGFWAGHYSLATYSALVGDKEQAFASLEKAFEYRAAQLTLLKIDPLLDPLRDDPRSDEMLRRAGFSVNQ